MAPHNNNIRQKFIFTNSKSFIFRHFAVFMFISLLILQFCAFVKSNEIQNINNSNSNNNNNAKNIKLSEKIPSVFPHHENHERSSENYYTSQSASVPSSSTYSSSSARLLDPLGVWKAASNMVRDGIHRFRESLHEGVKVAQMLKEDVNEGVSHLSKIQQRKSRNHNNDERMSSSNGSTTNHNVKGENEDEDLDLDLGPTENESNNAEDSFGFGHGQQLPRQGVLGGILKFMGVDSSSIGIILLNILIFVAEMVTSTMLGKDPNSIADTRMLKANLFEWVITGRNEKVSSILNEAQSHELPQHLIDTLQRRTGNKTSCVQLLVCKMSPFIWGIQKTVDKEFKDYYNKSNNSARSNTFNSFKDQDDQYSSAGSTRANNNNNMNDIDSYFSIKYLESIWSQLFQLIPDKHKFVAFSDNCEKKYPTCKLLKFPTKLNVNA